MRQIFVYRYHGYPASAQPDYPEGMPLRMIIYNWFGRARQWHPRQVDELDLDEVEWLPLMEEACLEAQDVIQKEVEAQNRHNR